MYGNLGWQLYSVQPGSDLRIKQCVQRLTVRALADRQNAEGWEGYRPSWALRRLWYVDDLPARAAELTGRNDCLLCALVARRLRPDLTPGHLRHWTAERRGDGCDLRRGGIGRSRESPYASSVILQERPTEPVASLSPYLAYLRRILTARSRRRSRSPTPNARSSPSPARRTSAPSSRRWAATSSSTTKTRGGRSS